MMEGIITQKVTPLLKCFVLFLFIFTAKVLTSRPYESQDSRNGFQHVRPLHYVRTFTKYHHIRPIHRNNHDASNHWPDTQELSKAVEKRIITHTSWPQISKSNEEKIIDQYSNQADWPAMRNKRSVIPDSNEFVGQNPSLNKFNSDVRENIASFDKNAINMGKMDQNKNGVFNDDKKYKVKAAIIVTDAPTTMGPTISCLYKIHSVSISATPSYTDDRNDQLMVESDTIETGPISETVLSSGLAQVEKCMDPRATCYTLWHQDKEGNITVLGQGCWRSSESQTCNKCTRVTARPDTKFCCCTKSFCNADFTSLKEETVTIKAESTMKATERAPDKYSSLYIYLFPIFLLIAMLMIGSLYYDLHCKKQPTNDEDSQVMDVEKVLKPSGRHKYGRIDSRACAPIGAVNKKSNAVLLVSVTSYHYNLSYNGEVMGSGPDALATGLSCVDNLTLIEHIGQGKFGSVWRGTLGVTPVAVKLYSSASTWQKEAAIYALPHLSHPNILRYYGSDTRQNLTEGYGREHLIVLELCSHTLRERLERAPLTWLEFASLAHGLAAALAHLHTPSGSKPCIVHRDVNSNNVLVSLSGGACRLADLGLAQLLLPRHDHAAPTRIAEAGTMRYLAPEALEGALDLCGAGAALCAVDVFALGLVLWEMVWRTRAAHAGAAPPYALPYHHHGLPARPTLSAMQTLVCRNKARPPLPKGPVPEARALKIATDTCDECWDHDAEARLTAVCVEERMNELKQLVSTQPPQIHDNMLHPHVNPSGEESTSSPPEPDKNSNVPRSRGDAAAPLLPRAHCGRNACIARNTHRSQQHAVLLVHKSLKDITAPVQSSEPRVTNEENCFSVARTSHTRIPVQENSLNEIRSYQRPLDYVQNDVSSQDSDRAPKQTNLLQDVKVEKPKSGIRKFFERLNKKKETEVKLVPEHSQRTRTSIVNDKPINVGFERPSNLVLDQERNYNFEAPCLSPPNRTLSPTMMEENVLGFKEMPPRENDTRTPNQIFAVIVPKAKPADFEMRSKSKGSSESINKQSVRTSMSSQSMFKSNSESEDSTLKKRLSCDNKIINSATSSKASINLELQYIDPETFNGQVSPFDLNSDCSSSEDEHLMLLSENGGSKITMQSIPKTQDVLKETSQTKAITFNKLQNKYTNFDNEFSDPNDKENVNGYSGDNPVYLAALKGEIDTAELKIYQESPNPKPCLKHLSIKRQHSLEQVSDLFTSAGDVNLLNPAGRVKTPGDLPVAVRKARRDRALQKGRGSESNRLSLYDDRMMFGNSL